MPDDIRLRTWQPADIEPCVELLDDPETVRWAGLPSPATVEDARQILAPDPPVLVRVIDVGGFAGIVRLTTHGSAAAEAELVVHPAHRGNGVATRALGMLADWAFAETDAAALSWRPQVGDYRSWRVAWHNGFAFAAMLPAAVDQRGSAQDAWATGLGRDDSREPTTRWISLPRLQLDGLAIRPQQSSDETRYLEAMVDPESNRWLGTLPFMPRTVDEFRAMMRRERLSATLGEAMTWTVADAASDSYLASISLFDLTGLDYKSAEVGYRTHPDARGRGVLTRSLRRVLTYAFQPEDDGGLGLERIHLGAGDGNLASQGVARSLGFTETGRDRHCYDLDDGSVVDLVRFDLLRSEFST